MSHRLESHPPPSLTMERFDSAVWYFATVDCSNIEPPLLAISNGSMAFARFEHTHTANAITLKARPA